MTILHCSLHLNVLCFRQYLPPKELPRVGILSLLTQNSAINSQHSTWQKVPSVVVVQSLSCVWLCDPMDCNPLGSSVHRILQARILEWVAISFSRGSSWPRDWTQVSHIASRCLNLWATRETHIYICSYQIHLKKKNHIIFSIAAENILPQTKYYSW